MYYADIAMAVVRVIVSLTLIVMLALGAFATDAGTVLAALVALTTSAGAVHNTIHAKTCEGHPEGKK